MRNYVLKVCGLLVASLGLFLVLYMSDINGYVLLFPMGVFFTGLLAVIFIREYYNVR
jgi:hypothetical protein